MLEKLKVLFSNKRYRSMEDYDINCEKLDKMIQQDAILLDVRSPQEYSEGHIAGAVLIPEYEIRAKAKQVLVNLDQSIIVYCSSGRRSKKAQKTLRALGYKNVYNLYNGFQNYWDF